MEAIAYRYCALLVLLAKCSALKQCENADGGSECGQQVVQAMVDGFALHPENFIGLTVHSSYSEFQAYFHNTGMHGCPRPCLPQEEKCVKFGPNYPGMTAIRWVRNDGMRNHPQWFPELSSSSSDLEIGKVLYQHGNKECPRICTEGEEEGHSVSADRWDEETSSEDLKDEKIEKQKEEKPKEEKKIKEAEEKPKEPEEKPFQHCGTPGISFDFLDVVGQLPATKSSSYECRSYCDSQQAIYFNFYAPTQTCHCPPEDAKIMKSVVQDNIGGEVRCASTEYIKKLEDEPKVSATSSPSRLLLLSAGVFVGALSAAVAVSRKTNLKEVLSSPSFGEEEPLPRSERALMLDTRQLADGELPDAI